MAQKLIDGNITITDNASKALSNIEKALKQIEKVAKPVTQAMKQLDATVNGMAKSTGSMAMSSKEATKNLMAQKRALAGLEAQALKERAKYDSVLTSNRRSLAIAKSDATLRNIEARKSARIAIQNNNVLGQQQIINQKSVATQLAQQQAHANKMQQIAFAGQIASQVATAKANAKVQAAQKINAIRQQRAARVAANATPFQAKMQAWAAGGGTFSPLWQVLGRHPNAIAALQSPNALTSGLAASLGNMGRFGRGATGFVAGRALGSIIGGGGGGLIGGLAGGAVAAGPVGMAIAAAASGIILGLQRLIGEVRQIADIMDEISSERATESTSLRRKMQMSSEMFGVDPRNVEEIDRKIYGYRPIEQQYYKRGMSGRDIITSGIEWLHLLGTKDIGGTFANEQQAFDFSEALSSIAKMNGLSEREYETVRYQGMQILSKGYADILDIKPLLNSAPGFVRDLLAQTGMSRKELLESGRSRSFTADKFIGALMGVKDYYAILSERESSRTMEQQEEAAKNIIGAASVWDEHYKKAKAESNQLVTDAVARSAIAEDIKKSWYQMWSFNNDAQDGINNKVKFEKWMTYQINGAIRNIYTTWLLIKNSVDLVLDAVGFIVGHIGAAILNIGDLITNAFKMALGSVLTDLGGLLKLDSLKEAGEALDPNSKRNREARAKEELSEALVEQIYADQRKGQHFIETKYSYLKDELVTGEIVTGTKKFSISVPVYSGMDDFGTGIAASAPEVEEIIERPWWGYSSARPLLDTVLYANDEDKLVGRLRDRSKMKKLVQDNYEQFVNAQGKFITVPRLEDPDAGMSLDTRQQASMMGSVVNLANELNLSGSGTDDYTYANKLSGRHGWVTDTFGRAVRNDVDDIKRGLKMNAEAGEEARKEYENVKDPYLDKIAKNTEEIKENTGKGSARVLDILKELAGITVINKVTKVRPDVVFNYGSYGRSGKLEDPNLIHVGEMDALAEFLMSFAKAYDDEGFKQEIPNGSANVENY